MLTAIAIYVYRMVTLVALLYGNLNIGNKESSSHGGGNMFVSFNTKEELSQHGMMRVELQYCKFARSTPVREFLSKGCQLWQLDSLYVPGNVPFVDSYKDIFRNGVKADMQEVGLDTHVIKYYSPDKIDGIINRAMLVQPEGYQELVDWLKEGKHYNGFIVI